MVLSAVAVGFPSEAQYVTVQRQARRVLSLCFLELLGFSSRPVEGCEVVLLSRGCR